MHVAKYTCQTGIKLNKMPLQTFTHIPLMLRTIQKNTHLFFIFCRYADYISDMYINMIILYVFSVQKNNLQYIKATDM